MLKNFVVAFQFLTVLPLFKAQRFENRDLARSMAAFPLVGAVLGALLAGFSYALGGRLPPLLEGALLVTALALLTGGLHLDGVADTVDGLGGGRGDKARALEIMKDSRVGGLGATALILTLLLKCAAVGYLLPEIKLWALLVMPAVARGSVVLLAYKSPYARPTGGLGTPYTEHLDALTLTAALVLSGAASFALGWRGAAAFGSLLVYALLLKAYFRSRLGGITGDVLGFAEETGEILFLLALYLLPGNAP